MKKRVTLMVAVAVVLFAVPAAAQYRYTDDKGISKVTQYKANIPAEYRDAAVWVGPTGASSIKSRETSEADRQMADAYIRRLEQQNWNDAKKAHANQWLLDQRRNEAVDEITQKCLTEATYASSRDFCRGFSARAKSRPAPATMEIAREQRDQMIREELDHIARECRLATGDEARFCRVWRDKTLQGLGK